MRPAYGMGRRSFSRPGALRFTAAPCSRLAKRRAVQQGGRPAIHSGAAPTSRPPRDRSRNGGQTGTAATRRAAVPCTLLHKPAGPPATAPSPRITRRAASARRPSPPGKARTSSSALARPLPSGKREPRPQRAPSSRITPRNRRAPPSTAAQPRFTTTPGDRRHSPRSTRQAADSPTARRKPASQQPPTTGHEMAGKPARQPPAGTAAPLRPLA